MRRMEYKIMTTRTVIIRHLLW